MIVVLTFTDGTEECFDVPAGTKLASAQRLGYWRFTLTTGAQVAYAEEAVQRVELGNIEFADDRGRVSAEGAETR